MAIKIVDLEEACEPLHRPALPHDDADIHQPTTVNSHALQMLAGGHSATNGISTRYLAGRSQPWPTEMDEVAPRLLWRERSQRSTAACQAVA